MQITNKNTISLPFPHTPREHAVHSATVTVHGSSYFKTYSTVPPWFE